jgi:hypothetical protein
MQTPLPLFILPANNPAKLRQLPQPATPSAKMGYEQSRPDKNTIHWEVSGRHKEFPRHTTYPQQDHRTDGKGINILPVVDRRAQPWPHVVVANCHSTKTGNINVDRLPSLSASVDEVKEFVYLVLTNLEWSPIGLLSPNAITATLCAWADDGESLRGLKNLGRQMCDLICPLAYYSIYDEIIHLTPTQRQAIGGIFYNHLRRLLLEEEEVANKSKEEKADSIKSADESTLNEKASIKSKVCCELSADKVHEVRIADHEQAQKTKRLLQRAFGKVFPCMRNQDMDSCKVIEDKLGQLDIDQKASTSTINDGKN